MYNVGQTSEFLKWLITQSAATRNGIEARIARIKFAGHFGDVKKLIRKLQSLDGEMD